MHTHPHMITHRDCTHTHTGGVGEDCAMYKLKKRKKLIDTNKKRDNLELNINNK